MIEQYIPHININDYDYVLPQEKIAFQPVSQRTGSKLLKVNMNTGSIGHYKFTDIVNHIPENSLLLVNNTKVIAARLLITKETGGKFELLLIEKDNNHPDDEIWQCMVGGRNIKQGNTYHLTDIIKNQRVSLHIEIISRTDNYAEVRFRVSGLSYSFYDIIEHFGKTPLPPYIKREATNSDKETYQTVFAQIEGSIAAPTAGLHFTDDIMTQILTIPNVEKAELTLHVGIGTFMPMSSDFAEEHRMHSERFSVNINTLKKIRDKLSSNGKLIATGTTSMRTIESVYWLGLKAIYEKYDIFNEIYLNQWDAYNYIFENKLIPANEIISEIISMMQSKSIDYLFGRTELMIVPGYKFQIINGLITNFHLPKSTLILLVAAFAGKSLWYKAYQEALNNNYRFLSYGDSSIWI